MYPLTIRLRLIGTVSLALALTGCASMDVNSYVERGINMRHYRTYNWAPRDERATGDPRLDNNRFFQERVQTAIEQQLGHRGFEKAATPDVLVRYHTSIVQDVFTQGSTPQDRYCDECGPEVYDAGTLLIDLVDAHTNRLVWRGWAKGSFDGEANDQQWMEQRIDDTIARTLRTL